MSGRLQDRSFGLNVTQISRVQISTSKNKYARSDHPTFQKTPRKSTKKKMEGTKVNRIRREVFLVVKGEGHLYLLKTALVLLLSERATLRQTSLASSGGAKNLHRNHVSTAAYNLKLRNKKETERAWSAAHTHTC